MHFQLYFIVKSIIIKLLCKLEENLKQNNQKPPHEKTATIVGQKQSHYPLSNIPISLRNLLSQEKDWNNRKTKLFYMK